MISSTAMRSGAAGMEGTSGMFRRRAEIGDGNGWFSDSDRALDAEAEETPACPKTAPGTIARTVNIKMHALMNRISFPDMGHKSNPHAVRTLAQRVSIQ